MLTMNKNTSRSSIAVSWETIETMTAAMFNAADAFNWTEVVEQATSRHHYLLQHFEMFPVGPENAEFYREHLSAMLNGEQELQNLVRNARKSLMSEGLTMQLNKRVVGAYLNASMD